MRIYAFKDEYAEQTFFCEPDNYRLVMPQRERLRSGPLVYVPRERPQPEAVNPAKKPFSGSGLP